MNRKLYKSIFLGILILVSFLTAPGILGETLESSPVETSEEELSLETMFQDPNRVILANEYIAVAVNKSSDATGRFGVKVTGGDPFRSGDEEKPLIYGFEKPWTSFTTIRIDDKDYIFGGKTRKRSGGTGEYGKIINSPVLDPETKSILMTCGFGAVEVTQDISVVESTTTGYPDTAKIKYTLVNKDDVPREVGVRVVIDTMLGENDGAPFRIGETAVQTDSVFDISRLPEFWQAFDTLAEPKVIAQGTLKGREATPPDFLYFTNWGSVADSYWEVPLVPERDFTRAGEFELDSAAVYTWQPITIPAAGSITYVLYYGLGGVTVVPGQLQLGVSSPAQVSLAEKEKTFSIVAYIQNTGEGPAMSTRARLNLPPGLALVGKKPQEIYIGKLAPGEMTQLHWDVKPTGSIIGTLSPYSVVTSAINIPENKVERSIRVVGPPKLVLTVNPPLSLKIVNDLISPDPYPITAVIKNAGESEAFGVTGSLQLGEGMKPAPKEILRRYVGNLKPGEEYKLTWFLTPEGIGKRTYVGVQFESTSTEPVMYIGGILLPVLIPKIRLVPLNTPKPGEFLAIEVRAENLPNLTGVDLNINFDPEFTEIIRVSRGLFFIENKAMTPWNPGNLNNLEGIVEKIGGSRVSAGPVNSTLATIHCKISSKPGETEIRPTKINLRSDLDKIPSYAVEGLRVIINEKGGMKIEPIKVE